MPRNVYVLSAPALTPRDAFPWKWSAAIMPAPGNPGFDDYAGRVGDSDGFLGEVDVFFIGMVAAIDHDGGVAVIDALLDEIDGVAVIAVDGDGEFGVIFDGGVDDVLEIANIGVFRLC